MYHTIPVQIRRETIFKAYLNIFKTRMFQEKRWKLLSETMEVESEGLSMELPYLQGNWKSRFQLQELTWHCNCPEMMTFYPKFLCTQLMKMGLLLKKILRTITYAWIIFFKGSQGSLPLKIKIKVFDDMKYFCWICEVWKKRKLTFRFWFVHYSHSTTNNNSY